MTADNGELVEPAPMTVKKNRILAAAVLAAVCAMQIARGWGHDLLIFQDEQQYLFGIRYETFAESFPPSYLYYLIYGALTPFGDQLLNAIRVLNTVFLLLSGFFVYLISRRLCGESLSLFIAIASVALPGSFYTALVLPEAMYCAAFWGLMWLLTGRA